MGNKNFKKWFGVSIVSLLVVMIVATSLIQISCSKKTEKAIKIGAILPLTGPVSIFGEEMKNGQELAKDLINSDYFWKKSKPVKILFEDSKADPKEAISALQRLKFNNTKFITSTLSPICLALLPTIKESEILFFGDAAHPKITSNGKLVFRHSNTAKQEAKTIASFIENELVFTDEIINVGLIVINDDYGISFREEFLNTFNNKKRYSIYSNEYEKTEFEFRSVVSNILYKDPIIVVICGVGKGPGLIVRRLKENKYDGEIISAIAFAFPEAQKSAGAAKKGVYFNTYDFNRDDLIYKKVNEIYKEKYGNDMPDLTILEFNTIYLLANAINKVGYDPIQVSQYIYSLKEFNGVGEKMLIYSSGDIVPNLKVIKCEGEE